MDTMYNDKYLDYSIVVEQVSPEGAKVKEVKEEKRDGLNFLRFETCLQTFKGLNRNKRDWKGIYVKQMIEGPEVQELLKRGSMVGESGHPCGDTAPVTLQRICHIDPERTSHRITKFDWPDADTLNGTIETLAGTGPGNTLMMNIKQGIQPAFSLRSIVPQRKELNGVTVVLGPGRLIAYDRVYLPSHSDAYMLDVPVKNIVTRDQFDVVMESYMGHMMNTSDKLRRITDGMDIALETSTYDVKTQTASIQTSEGRIFAVPEMKHRKEISSFFRRF